MFLENCLLCSPDLALHSTFWFLMIARSWSIQKSLRVFSVNRWIKKRGRGRLSIYLSMYYLLSMHWQVAIVKFFLGQEIFSTMVFVFFATRIRKETNNGLVVELSPPIANKHAMKWNGDLMITNLVPGESPRGIQSSFYYWAVNWKSITVVQEKSENQTDWLTQKS